MNEIRFSYQGIEYELRDTKSVTILNSLVDYCKHRNSLELPDQVNNWDSSYKVKSIRSGAFTNISIENLTIDCSHFKSLPNRVFSFSSIKTLKLINTRSTFSMSGETFAFADDLENIIFDENEKNFLFQNGVLYDLKNSKVLFVTKNVQKIDVISSMVEISDFACQNCTQLTKVIFSNNSSLKRIGQYAFKNCTNLKIIELPNNISTIDKYAFENCFNLLNIKLSEQLSIIDKKAFYLCSSLEIIVIPSCIKLVGKKAFSRCSSLNNVYFCCSKKDVNIFKNSFDNDIHNENFNSKLSVIFDHVQALDHDDVFFGEMQWEEYRQIEKLLIKAQAFHSKVQEEINQIAETKFVMKEEGSEPNRNELFYQFLSDKQKLFDSMCNYIYGDEKTSGDAKLLELTLDHKNKEIKEIKKKIDQLKNQHLISKMNFDDMAREKESLFDDNRKVYSLKSELLEKENIRILLNENVKNCNPKFLI
ncbi:hypothetical protein TRFO_01533 [Tritrichomonas foetus]|uniref:Surface antigen BspA-like n=1 Tax=Tritrichomonas foetus TaxID=1144522 RepID=A0A1J4K267_9EUKA|nr:hypothetical protein TRFO_01533 [Tritrichomonas foetus]|eukprot:OHT03830.1 hypothetical protein TRFO_01533 [Tritrichomonas foetus]